jgi:uncharacterized membrane protein YheB (UPF0754 family)
MLLGGFIGGVTNKIAIKMLFEKKWFLPGSGVLLKKHREIIHSLAETAESHLINTEMIQEELRKVLKPIKISKAKQIINQIIDEFREDIRKYLNAKTTHHEIEEIIKTKLGFLGAFLNITRIKEYEEMTDTIISELDFQLSQFRVSEPMIVKTIQKIGTLEDFLFKPNNDLLVKHYKTDKSLAQLLFERINIKKMVADKLSDYQPHEVKNIIEDNIRDHLLWLEVFGVFLGMLFSGTLLGFLHFFQK